MASTVVSFELALVVDLPLWWTSTVASFEASPENTMLCTNLKNELSCLEPACFFEMRATEAAGLASRRRLTAKDLTVEVILTIPEENAMDGSQATDATRAAAASVASTVEAAVAALLSGHHHQLASRLGMEVTPDPNPNPNPHPRPHPHTHPHPHPHTHTHTHTHTHPNQAISALGGSSVQGRLMGVNQAVEAAGRMGGQVLVAVLYDISPLHACAMPVVANAIAAAAMALALALERLHTRRAGLSAAVLV